MTGMEIAVLFVSILASYSWGHISGYNEGVREGRRAVRKYYEGLNK